MEYVGLALGWLKDYSGLVILALIIMGFYWQKMSNDFLKGKIDDIERIQKRIDTAHLKEVSVLEKTIELKEAETSAANRKLEDSKAQQQIQFENAKAQQQTIEFQKQTIALMQTDLHRMETAQPRVAFPVSSATAISGTMGSCLEALMPPNTIEYIGGESPAHNIESHTLLSNSLSNKPKRYGP